MEEEIGFIQHHLFKAQSLRRAYRRLLKRGDISPDPKMLTQMNKEITMLRRILKRLNNIHACS